MVWKITIQNLIVVLFLSISVFAQKKDTVLVLNEAEVKAFSLERNRMDIPAAISTISSHAIARFDNTNFSNVFNEQAGVRLEERSPGSYRIAIRGSSLRSPFGVRNVKVYLNAIPLTDANGITYFNQLDINSVANLEIIKGPSSSLYGAGIGGVILMNSKAAPPDFTLGNSTLIGSFNTLNTHFFGSFGSKKSNTFISYSNKKTDGYREHSAANQQAFNLNSSLFLKPNHTLNILGLVSEVNYETPGGLTLEQMLANRRASRPKTASLPSAIAQKASIYQKMFQFGLSDISHFKNNWKLSTSLGFNHAYLENPFITVFEKRNENSLSNRMEIVKKWASLKMIFGNEMLFSNSDFKNFNNDKGEATSWQNHSDAKSIQNATFIQFDKQLPNSFFINFGGSYNLQTVNYKQYAVTSTQTDGVYKIKPAVPFSPRFGIVKKLKNVLSLYGTWSTGFSSPTVQELNSTFIFATNAKTLTAEKAQNTELGMKLNLPRINFEMAAYSQKIKNALVRKLTTAGNEYFQNVGKIIQNGLEISSNFEIIKSNDFKFISALNLKTNYTFNDYRYLDFIQAGTDFSQNKLPGIAKNNLFFIVHLKQKNGFFLNIDVNSLSKIALNDANSAWASAAWIGNGRIGFEKDVKNVAFKVFFGSDNFLNQSYSLGYDFNAVGNRYYNPAPKRTFNSGISLSFKI